MRSGAVGSTAVAWSVSPLAMLVRHQAASSTGSGPPTPNWRAAPRSGTAPASTATSTWNTKAFGRGRAGEERQAEEVSAPPMTPTSKS